MSEKEKAIVEKIKKAIPKMSEFDKGYFLGKVENLADEGKSNEEDRSREETKYLEKELGTKVENMIATAKREVEESLVKSLEQKLKENLAKETIERMNIPDVLKRFSEMALEDKTE